MITELNTLLTVYSNIKEPNHLSAPPNYEQQRKNIMELVSTYTAFKPTMSQKTTYVIDPRQ